MVPIMLAGVEAGHALGNLVAGAPAGEVFSDGASGRGALPWLTAALAVVVVSALAARAAGVGARARVTPRLFSLLPPVAFVLLELAETAANARPFATTFDRSFLAGLALQAPVAVVGYVLACALVRLSDEVRSLLACPTPAAFLHAPWRPPRPAGEMLPISFVVETTRGRGPPLAPLPAR